MSMKLNTVGENQYDMHAYNLKQEHALMLCVAGFI